MTESGNKVTTTVYAGSGDYSDVNFRLDCYGYEGYVMVSYNGGSDSGESWYVEASTEDESGKEIYSGYDFSADGYGYIYVKDWIEIFVSGDSNDWWTDISVVSVDMTTLKKGYWYDENGKGLINYPLNRNHTIKAVWSSGDITLPEAPAKEGYEFVGWRTEDAKLMTADYKKADDDEDYNDCMNKFNGDVATWYGGGKVYLTIQNTRVTVGNTDLSLVAKANANNYKITYNLNGGTHGVLHPDSAEYDSTVTISNPTKTGYTFTGWTITRLSKQRNMI